ncbi:MAG: sugar kinase [Verrucomicrobia bacterium]|nr:sugar kinase [Verrucomicrobiota bacterium]
MRPNRRRGVFVGLTTVDVVLRVDRHPQANEKTVAGERLLLAGGPAANAAIAFVRRGGVATLVTELGRSALAELARADLVAEGVEVVDLAPPDAGPPLAVVLSAAFDGSRAVVLSRPTATNANRPAGSGSDVDLSGAAVLLTDGHHPHLALPLVERARRTAVPTVLDAGSWKPVLGQLCPAIDYAIASADFAPDGCALDRLQELGVAQVAVSAGAEPIRWRDFPGRSGHIPVPQVDVVDTLGAGDVLHGAFCWFLAQGLDFPSALQAAAGVASESCRTFGRSLRA